MVPMRGRNLTAEARYRGVGRFPRFCASPAAFLLSLSAVAMLTHCSAERSGRVYFFIGLPATKAAADLFAAGFQWPTGAWPLTGPTRRISKRTIGTSTAANMDQL